MAITQIPWAWAPTALRTSALTTPPLQCDLAAAGEPVSSARSCSIVTPGSRCTFMFVVAVPTSPSRSHGGNTATEYSVSRTSAPSMMPTSSTSSDGPAAAEMSKNSPRSACSWVKLTMRNRSPSWTSWRWAKVWPTTNSWSSVASRASHEARRRRSCAGEADGVLGRSGVRIHDAGEDERHCVDGADAGQGSHLGRAWRSPRLLDVAVRVPTDRRREGVGCGRRPAGARGERQHGAGDDGDDGGDGQG